MRRTIEKRREVHPSSVLSPAVTHYPLRRALLIINKDITDYVRWSVDYVSR